MAIYGQQRVTESAGMDPFGVFWLTHAESMSPEEQVNQMDTYSFIRES